MFAIVLFGLVGLAGASATIGSVQVSQRVRNQSQAAALASSSVETIRSNGSVACAWQSPLPTGCSASASVVPVGTSTSTKTVGNIPFTITQTTEFESKSTLAACNASTQGGAAGVQPVLLVTEAVSWSTMNGAAPVTSQTILTPPAGAFANSSGAIDVSVVNGLNQPDAGIPVTVNGPSGTSTYTTDANGCALAGYLAPGSYTVTIVKSGYIDSQESATSAQTLGVTTGNVTTSTFFFDASATLGATFVPATSWPSSVPFVAPTGLPVTVANSGLSGSGTYQLPNGVSGSAVYPYVSGYNIWAGRCPEANPDAVTSSGSPLYPVPPSGTAPAPTTVATSAGLPATASVPLYPLTINFTDTASKAVTFKITEVAGSAKTSCTGFQTYSLPLSPVGQRTTVTSYVIGVPLGTFTLSGTDGGATRTFTPNVNVGLNGATTTVGL